MSLDTYANLKTAIARTLRRTDLTSDIPDFITLAEGKMSRRLRVRRMIARATASLSDEYSAVPSDFLGVRTFSLAGDTPQELRFVTPDQMDALAGGYTATGTPECYTVVGGEFRYWPAPAEALDAKLTYWQSIPALSDANTSNWLLANHPDAYLYGACAASAPFLKNDERLATWGGLFMSALDEIETADMSESYGGVLSAIPSAPAI